MPFNFKQRLFFFFAAMLFFLGVFYLGFIAKIDKSISEELTKNFIHEVHGIDQFGIFLNNFKISLIMFVPVIGIILGVISAFSTGLIFNSIISMSHTPTYNPLIVFLTPFGILELLSYGLAISRGGILFYELVKKTISKKSIIYLLVEIGLVGFMLFLGALIEWNMIANLPKKL